MYTIEKCAKALIASVEVKNRFNKAGQPARYWDEQVSKWSCRLMVAVDEQSFSKSELKALFDAAHNMSDDFREYFAFMGSKRADKHTDNFNSAMEKIKTLIR